MALQVPMVRIQDPNIDGFRTHGSVDSRVQAVAYQALWNVGHAPPQMMLP